MNDTGQPSPFAHQARALLARYPLIDGHNDLPMLIRRDSAGDVRAYDLLTQKPGRDTDIPRMRASCVGAQFWAAFIPPRETRPASFALQQIAIVRRMVETHPHHFMLATCADDIARANESGKIACLVTIENGAALEGRIDTLDMFHALGVRLMTLCHNATTDWCDSATDAPQHGGLNDLGRKVIARMNDLGIIIDLAHVTDNVMHQVLDISRAPVVWSHSNVRDLCDHPRNVPASVLSRVRENGGVVMATFVPDFLRKAPRTQGPSSVPFAERGDIEDYCNHVAFLANAVGHDHIGIGSDFFGGPQGAGLVDQQCFPDIIARLMQRGWSEDNLARLARTNILRVMKAVEAGAATAVK